MTAKILQFRDYQGLAESRLPPEEVGSVVAWPISARDTAPSEFSSDEYWESAINCGIAALSPFIAPDGDSA